MKRRRAPARRRRRGGRGRQARRDGVGVDCCCAGGRRSHGAGLRCRARGSRAAVASRRILGRRRVRRPVAGREDHGEVVVTASAIQTVILPSLLDFFSVLDCGLQSLERWKESAT